MQKADRHGINYSCYNPNEMGQQKDLRERKNLKQNDFFCASILKQDPNTKKFDIDTQCASFRGNPLCQATKPHLNNR